MKTQIFKVLFLIFLLDVVVYPNDISTAHTSIWQSGFWTVLGDSVLTQTIPLAISWHGPGGL